MHSCAHPVHRGRIIFALLLYLPLQISALGINCRGSGLCPRASWNNKLSITIIQGLRDAIYATSKDKSTTYSSGSHVICVSQSQSISIGVNVGDGIVGTFALTGTINEGGICLFPQRASLTLGQIRPLVDAILEHKCETCGSVPIHFVDEGSNDPSDGILTFNYVADPFCDKDCISDTGSPGSGNNESTAPATTSKGSIPTTLTVTKITGSTSASQVMQTTASSRSSSSYSSSSFSQSSSSSQSSASLQPSTFPQSAPSQEQTGTNTEAPRTTATVSQSVASQAQVTDAEDPTTTSQDHSTDAEASATGVTISQSADQLTTTQISASIETVTESARSSGSSQNTTPANRAGRQNITSNIWWIVTGVVAFT